MDDIVILSAVRTPIGSIQGELAGLAAPELGARALAAAFERAGVGAEDVEQVYMGSVLTAGVGQAPARQAALGAGCPESTGAVTVGKVCGSAMRAAMIAANDLRCGDFALVAAGGMESMSRAPYLAPGARDGLRLGHGRLVDSMIHDGLWDPYGDKHMGNCAELCAAEYSFSREEQDAYALVSYQRARQATEDGTFAREIVPVEIAGRKGETRTVGRDEEPFRVDLDKIGSLKPAFQKDGGTVTAGNASKINDGAAALVLTTAAHARALGRRPIARIVAHSTTRRPRSGSPRRRSARSRTSSAAPGSGSTTSTSGRSTRPSRWWRWRSCATSSSTPTGSTSTAARSPSATRSAPRGRASWSPSSTRWSCAAPAAAAPRSASAAVRRPP